jgi:peptidoglycan hydrolase-like protein with peptidoglycan-binding domain
MSSTVSPDQAAGPGTSTPGGHRSSSRRRWVIVVVVIVVVVAAGTAAAAASGVFKSSPSGSGLSSQYRTSSAVVKRRSLESQSDLSGTLGDSGSYTVTNEATGTITWLPAVGAVVHRGQRLYAVDGAPVVLLYGNTPAYRTLSEGMTGADVRELNKNLIALGYTTRASVLAAGLGLGYYSAATAAALETYQTALGITSPTGSLTLGQAVFLPTSAKITELETGIVTGAPAAPGTALLTATSTTPVATIDLNTSQEGEIKTGDHVGITLPDGTYTPGVVTSVGKVATTNASGTTSVTVLVSLTHPQAAGGLSQAPVTVSVTTGSVSNVLVVPVDALLARSSGGYAVEVIGPHGHHLVPVSVGMFDDAAGLVQVSGSGLAAGQRVVVPAL